MFKNFALVGIAAIGASVFAPSAANALTLQIDDFSQGAQTLSTTTSTTLTATEAGPFGSILGGYRDLSAAFSQNAGPGLTASVAVDAGSSNTLSISTPPQWTTITTVTWDGVGGPGAGFTSTDFLNFGDRLRIDVVFADLNGSTAQFILTDSTAATSTQTLAIPASGNIDFLFGNFTGTAVLSDITKVSLVINGVNSFDGQFSIVGVTRGVPEPVTAGLSLLSLAALGASALRRRHA